ncbi:MULTISPECIES: thioredoxin family protein [unclassified Bacillus (in: firmicutes)]|uniref:thioredoxin family protein n=1 Tax=unclassified Bacillus (in: firmicutes) TaxID=185979 RepID=UPI0008E80666|nr:MULTISPECIES: thioredoxin family protein [unclassified Bacillus (in: firmicutes)]SFJ94669.1 Thioredoxin [Bacillus sp. 71mf]SFS99564.1 Thioredoxin [Bacillus sp. 103mf]
MKKMFLFGGIVIALLIAIFAVSNIEQKEEAKTDYYTNKISLDDIRKNIQEKKDQTIYFYQTSCPHCHKVSPIIVPMAKDMNIDVKVIDLENEPKAVWDELKITGTPTIIHFKEGKEVSRIEGEQPKDEFKKWFTQNKK